MKIFTRPYIYIVLSFLLIIVISDVFQVNLRTGIKTGNFRKLVTLHKPKLEYGLPVDSFEVIKGKINQNAFLSDILMKFNVSSSVVNKMEKAAKGIFDIRKIKAGNTFTLFRSKHDQQPEYLVYQHTPVEYYVVSLKDSISVEKKEKKIRTVHRDVSGMIHSSLWEAVKSQNINPVVATELSEIYAWSIDFFGLQQGDAFKMMYDEQYVDTLSVGIGKIYGAWFRHAGKEYYAIPFIQNNSVSFYDLDGKSLKKAFLKAPLKFSRISSTFTASRFHPVLKRFTAHFGVDYAASVGTPVHSIGDGTVVEARYAGGAGNYIRIRHNGTYTTGYMHLRAFASGIAIGRAVKQGDLIGYVGSTGLSTGPHLDFRVWKNNAPVNPLTMESPSVDPIRAENKQAFTMTSSRISADLKNISFPGQEKQLMASR